MATRLGFPAISTPNALDLRAVGGAISNARQRIEQLEALYATILSAGTSTSQTATANLKLLAQQIAALSARVTILENAATTDIGSFIAGESITIGMGVVPLGVGTVGVADPSDPTRMFGLIGIATNSASVGQAVLVQRRGVFAPPGLSGLEAGRAVYIDIDGALTQYPSYDATALPVGAAVSATQLFIAPDWPALQGPIFASSVGDAYIRFLPVAFSMVERIVEVMNTLFDAAPGFVYWTGTELITDPTPIETNNLVTNGGDALVTNGGDNLVWN